jgi:pantetheine-phosphate adenylyltransferase
MTTALYPGAFDPITNGHLDIAIRASRLFDKVIVGVYDTPAKNLMFTTEEIVELVRKATADKPNIEARCFSCLTVDFAKEIGAQTIVRGLRVVTDFETEYEMALMNKKLSPEIELVCLMTTLEFQFISSSLIKEVTNLGGKIEDLVPAAVADALKKKLPIKNT